MPASAVLPTALRDLLRAHAPDATLLAAVDEQILNIRSDAPPLLEAGRDLIPPDDWLAGGELAWITRDGALLGLLWSKDSTIPPGAVEVLTLLLSAASAQGASREADMLITQLPAATAWLSAELQFKQVSRTFLELFGLGSEQVLGRTVAEVFAADPPLAALLAEQLAGAAAGRFVRLQDIRPASIQPDHERQRPPERWLRGEAKPYFGGAAAGVLWTLQEVSAEYQGRQELRALLETTAPLALLDGSGNVRHASQSLSHLLAQHPPQPPQAESKTPSVSEHPLWEWPIFAPESRQALQQLAQQPSAPQSGPPQPAPPQSTQASQDAASSVALPLVQGVLAQGDSWRLRARRSQAAPELVLIEGQEPRQAADSAPPLLALNELALSEHAALILDHAGRVQLVGPQAAELLQLNPQQVIGLKLIRVLQQVGAKLQSKRGDALPWPDLRALPLPFKHEIGLLLPGGKLRQLEVSLTEHQLGPQKPGLLLSLRDLTALRQTQAKLQHNINHDPLTGLLNRDGLRRHLNTSARSGMVAVMDIDSFAGLNAALGKTAGDLLLIQVAARLNDLGNDLSGRAARLSKDTFALYLPLLSAEVGVQKLQVALQEPLRAGKRVVPMTFAIGTAELNAADASTADTSAGQPENALEDAETALQHAKRQGRSAIRQFSQGLRHQEAQNFELEADLRHAIEHDLGQFSLLYQPAVSLRDGRAFSAEALLRWTHPTQGNISPARFIPLASRSDLITQLGEWVIKEAGQGRAALRESSGQGDWRISINLSLEELRRPRAAQRLLPLMSKLNAVDIEVAASSLLDYSTETLEVLESLRSKGSRLLVDDFGDHHSNLSALTRFPLSGLKLHPTLIARLPEDQKTARLVQGAVSLAHSLGLSVTAVGVESYPQLDLLRDLEVDAAQGYAFTPPLSVTDLSEWLVARRG